MSSRGVVELGDLIGRLERLEVECSRCDRRGLYRLSRLIATHGGDFDLGRLRQHLARDCAGATASHFGERCDLRFPQLVGLWRRN